MSLVGSSSGAGGVGASSTASSGSEAASSSTSSFQCAPWQCPTCFLSCKENEQQCASCGTKHPAFVALHEAAVAKLKFGFSASQPHSFGRSNEENIAAEEAPPAPRFGTDPAPRFGDGAAGAGPASSGGDGKPLLSRTTMEVNPTPNFGFAAPIFGAAGAANPPPADNAASSTSSCLTFGRNGSIRGIPADQAATTPPAGPTPTPLSAGPGLAFSVTPTRAADFSRLLENFDAAAAGWVASGDGDPGTAPSRRVRLKSQSGVVFTWGSNECDQLALHSSALDAFNCRPVPAGIRRLSERDDQVSAIACGAMFSLALESDGSTVYSWGCGDTGALGRPFKKAPAEARAWFDEHLPGVAAEWGARVPAPVYGLPPDGDRVVQIAAGDGHGVALTDAGDCFCWGQYRDRFGPLGIWSPSQSQIAPSLWVPERVPLGDAVAIECAAGEDHTVLLCEEHSGQRFLLLWGNNQSCQLAAPLPDDELAYHSVRKNFLKPTKVYLKDMELRTYSEATKTLVPDTEAAQHGVLHHVYATPGATFISVSVKGETRLYGFGKNSAGELGAGFVDPKQHSFHRPLKVLMPSDTIGIEQLVGGSQVTLALTSDGSIWSWGLASGTGIAKAQRPGVSDPMDQGNFISLPQPIVGLRNRIRCVTANQGHTFAAISNCGRHVFFWGDGHSFLFGDGQERDLQILPYHSPLLSSVAAEAEQATPGSGQNLRLSAVALGAQHGLLLCSTLDSVGEEIRVAAHKRRRVDTIDLDGVSASGLSTGPALISDNGQLTDRAMQASDESGASASGPDLGLKRRRIEPPQRDHIGSAADPEAADQPAAELAMPPPRPMRDAAEDAATEAEEEGDRAAEHLGPPPHADDAEEVDEEEEEEADDAEEEADEEEGEDDASVEESAAEADEEPPVPPTIASQKKTPPTSSGSSSQKGARKPPTQKAAVARTAAQRGKAATAAKPKAKRKAKEVRKAPAEVKRREPVRAQPRQLRGAKPPPAETPEASGAESDTESEGTAQEPEPEPELTRPTRARRAAAAKPKAAPAKKAAVAPKKPTGKATAKATPAKGTPAAEASVTAKREAAKRAPAPATATSRPTRRKKEEVAEEPDELSAEEEPAAAAAPRRRKAAAEPSAPSAPTRRRQAAAAAEQPAAAVRRRQAKEPAAAEAAPEPPAPKGATRGKTVKPTAAAATAKSTTPAATAKPGKAAPARAAGRTARRQ